MRPGGGRFAHRNKYRLISIKAVRYLRAHWPSYRSYLYRACFLLGRGFKHAWVQLCRDVSGLRAGRFPRTPAYTPKGPSMVGKRIYLPYLNLGDRVPKRHVPASVYRSLPLDLHRSFKYRRPHHFAHGSGMVCSRINLRAYPHLPR